MGRKIEFTHVPGTPSVEIVGVVGDIKEGEMDEDTWPTLYVPFDQNPSGFFSVAVRASRNAATIHRIDPAIATFRPGDHAASNRWCPGGGIYGVLRHGW